MSGDTEWRWADPSGQQRLVRTDELLAGLAGGVIAPNTPVWRSGWKEWKPAYEVPELTSNALASANGIVPNIPPPPLFMVAVQHDYEDKSVPQSRPAPTTEPPPPPPYVPSRVANRSPVQAVVQPKTSEPSPSVPQLEPSPKPPLAQPPTMTGIGAEPLPVDVEAKTTVDLPVLSAAPTSRVLTGHPTMHGIPELAQPSLPPLPPLLSPTSVPTTLAEGGSMALSPSYAPRTLSPSTKPSPLVSSRPPPPLRKRPTLLLYGGAPEKPAPEPKNGEHPSINVPAPGAQAPKAVTQAPPWSDDWANLDPTIPKPAPTPLPAMRSIADSIEEITGAVLLPPEEVSAKAAPAEQTPEAEQNAEELSASHMIPEPTGGASPTMIDTEAVTIAGAPSPLSPTASDGGHDSEAPREGPLAVPSPSPSLRLVHDLSDLWSRPEKRWMLAVGAAGALLVVVGTIGAIVRVASGSPHETPHEESPVATAAPAVGTPAPPPAAEPAPTASSGAGADSVTTSFVPCGVAGAPHVVAPKAQLRIGVEASAQNHLALGFVTGDRDGFAVTLESPSLVALGTAKQHAHESIRRVVPLAGPGKTLTAIADVERKTDKIAGGRTVGNGLFVLGSADGKLAWGAHAGDAPHPLWPLENDAPAEALRAVALDGGGYALAFRQGASIYLGMLNADKTPSGELVHVAGLGPQIGSPALGASGKAILMAWADRASSTDPWGVRLLEWKRGEAPGEARAFSIPPGGLGQQAMSPGLAGLSGGRFLLAWTEGPVASHQVRAVTLGAAAEVLGSALTISAEGVNAGQGQVAVLPDGKGLVVYMASPTGSTAEVVATPVACSPSPM